MTRPRGCVLNSNSTVCNFAQTAGSRPDFRTQGSPPGLSDARSGGAPDRRRQPDERAPHKHHRGLIPQSRRGNPEPLDSYRRGRAFPRLFGGTSSRDDRRRPCGCHEEKH